MAHKTIYVDIDDEITTIIDRLKKSKSVDNIIVVPKQATLLQSLVNLKLLKQEAGRQKKKIIVVTQDKIGKKLIQKAGIAVEEKSIEPKSKEEIQMELAPKKEPKKEDKKILEDLREDEMNIGSDRYFEEIAPAPRNRMIGKISFPQNKQEQKEDIEPKIPPHEEQSKRMSDIVSGSKSMTTKRERKEDYNGEGRLKRPASEESTPKKATAYNRDIGHKTELFFKSPPVFEENSDRAAVRKRPRSEKADKLLKAKKIGRRTHVYFLIFIATLFLFGSSAVAYLYLPKASIIVHFKEQEKTLSTEIETGINIQSASAEGRIIPASLEELELEKSGDFEATGSASGGNKAVGKAVIYNEFSTADQPLVATTRLETKDGKTFRITKGIAVPGMKKDGDEIIPGSMEVDVIADESGDEYNIEPSDFTIPGFANSQKFEKFYAKSFQAMTGGSETGSKAVSSDDIEEARSFLTAELKEQAIIDLKKKLSGEKRFFEGAIEFEGLDFSSSVSAGTAVEKFTAKQKMRVKTFSFSEEDVRKILENEALGEENEYSIINFKKGINYILSDYSLSDGWMKFQAKTDAIPVGDFDLDNFKNGIKGKNTAELEEFVKNYPAVSKIDVSLWPFFIDRIPMNSNRVDVEFK